jgi:hypothetical protein
LPAGRRGIFLFHFLQKILLKAKRIKRLISKKRIKKTSYDAHMETGTETENINEILYLKKG